MLLPNSSSHDTSTNNARLCVVIWRQSWDKVFVLYKLHLGWTTLQGLRHKDGGYDKDFFLDFIIEKTFQSLHGLRDIRLPHFLDTRWYHIHRKFISHHDLHRGNIKLASVLEDFLETKTRTSTVADDDDSFDDDEVTSIAGEGAMDSSQANDYDNPEFSDTEEAIEKSAPENTSTPDVQRQSPPENKSAPAMAKDEERKINCDWGQVGLCVIPENHHLDNCQDSVGRCSNHLHHLCLITYVNKCGLPESTSITKLCQTHCTQYCEQRRTVQKKSRPENLSAPASQRDATTTDVAVGTSARDGTTMEDAVGVEERILPKIPSLPRLLVAPQTQWTCPKCKGELRITTKRCGNCKTWQFGKRGGKTPRKGVTDALNKTPTNQKNSGLGRPSKKQKTTGTEVVAVDVIRTGATGADVSPLGDSPAANLDDFSISMTNSITTIDDSLLQGLEEDDNNTVTRETRDRRIMQLVCKHWRTKARRYSLVSS